ncbi:MAG: rsmD [Ignavibacteria bacterium]|nr:rsmD [Ignavibacteria bacterium]
MRIISGKYGGRHLPKGVPSGIRPTTDSSREAIFNILQNFTDFNSLQVLDICSGTGALGIEALSRGAEHCNFIDKSKISIEYLKNCLDYFKIPNENYSIICKDALRALKELGSKEPLPQFDLVFTDPPYKEFLNNKIIHDLIQTKLVHIGTILMAEHSIHEIIDKVHSIKFLSNKRYGETIIEIIEFTGI